MIIVNRLENRSFGPFGSSTGILSVNWWINNSAYFNLSGLIIANYWGILQLLLLPAQ
jgi:hypothetical protein